jgi:hypothetical protein
LRTLITHYPFVALYPACAAFGAGLLGLLENNFRPAPNNLPVIPLLLLCQTSFHSLILPSIHGIRLWTDNSLTNAASRWVSSADNLDPYSFFRAGLSAKLSPSWSPEERGDSGLILGDSAAEDRAEA